MCFSYSVEKPHVKKKVDPGQGDGDCTYLPMQAGALVTNEIIGSDKESKAVDKGIEEEDGWKVRRPRQLQHLQLAPDRLQLAPD